MSGLFISGSRIVGQGKHVNRCARLPRVKLEEIQKAIWHGDCDNYLVKPISQADLVALLKKYNLTDPLGLKYSGEDSVVLESSE